MKRKAISSLLCALAIIQMSVTPAYATNTTQQTSTPGNQSATITYDQGSKFTVTIPKTIALDKTKTHTYNVKVEGDISADEAVTVTPDATVAMTDTNSKNSVTGTITQEKTKFVATEVNQVDGTTTTGNISAPDLKAGNWSGQFNFYINVDANKHTHNYVESITKAATCTDTGVKTLTCSCGDTYTETIPATGHNYENGTCTECGAKDPDYVSEEAGLYDADGKLLCTWEDSGINIEKDYTDKNYNTEEDSPYYVISNNYDKTTKVILPSETTKVGNYAFYKLEDLTNIEIGNSITNIGGHAFQGCTKLISITIPDSVTNIGGHAFTGCDSLTSIDIPYGITELKDNTFSGCDSLTSVNIPDSVTSIGMTVFGLCTSLEDIQLPDGITKVSEYTFEGCTSLKHVNIPSSATWIAYQAFLNCTSLEEISIPNSVTRIGRYAFQGCTGFTDLTIPSSTKTIDDGAFTGVKHITYKGTASGRPWGALSIN